MRRATIALGVLIVGLVLLALAAGQRSLDREPDLAQSPSPVIAPPTEGESSPVAVEAYQGFLHGRVTATGGAVYQGRLRWGGNEEAFWGDLFDGVHQENRWAGQVPPEQLPSEHLPVSFFGVEVARRERPLDLERPFRARFGDVARVEARGTVVQVTLKSGTTFDLDRFDATDLDDGVRVWDPHHGVIDLGARRIHTVELFPAAGSHPVPSRLHGTVRTRQGELSGFVQWDREACVGTDQLDGRSADGDLRLRFDAVASIARRSRDGARVTLTDGREIELSGHPDVDHRNRGIYVDDQRYGRVRVAWDAFERVDFSPGGSGPAYDEFPAGHPLTGRVTARDGLHLSGRIVFDLDESETTDTLDASSGGLHFTIPFERIATIVPARDVVVSLHGGEELVLEPSGDLGDGNAGVLVFVDGRPQPDYLPWGEVARIELDRPATMFPPSRKLRPEPGEHAGSQGGVDQPVE